MTWKLDDLQSLTDFLLLKAPLFAPSGKDQQHLSFQRLSAGDKLDISRRTDISCRSLFQPETHYYLSFDRQSGSKPVFQDFEGDGRIILGLRPCDIAGVRIFDNIFCESGSFRILREGTTIIGYLCDRREPACFCESVGVNPHDSDGMDLVLFLGPDDNYYLESLTDKGSTLMEDSPFPESNAEPRLIQDTGHVSTPLPDNLEAILLNSDQAQWDRISFACLNCRICTYICPACSCFTITDEVFKGETARAAVWDSCQSRTFTKEASGHNPRESGTARARQRILHKFSYYPSLNDGAVMCGGCGRCITSCPTGRSILQDISELTAEVSDV